MRPWSRLLIALVIVLGGLGCGGDETTVGAGDADGDTPVSEPSDPTEPTDLGDTAEPPGGAQDVIPEPGVGENLRPRPFDRAVVGADGTTVDVYFYGGVAECYVVDRVEVDRSDPAAIRLTLYEGGRPGADVCIEIAVAYVTTVRLDPPADPSTPVVDGTDGQVKS
jgi:hypothetical protein